MAYSDKKEQLMVDRLCKSSAFVSEPSLVAQTDTDQLVGHILLTKLHIQYQQHWYQGLALAPLSIIPGYQNQGIGSQLVRQSHAIVQALSYA